MPSKTVILKLGSGNVQNVSRNGRVFFKNLSTSRPVTQEKFASIFTVIGSKNLYFILNQSDARSNIKLIFPNF